MRPTVRAAAWSEALTTTQGPRVDGLLVQRKVGSGGSRRRLLAPVLLAGLVMKA